MAINLRKHLALNIFKGLGFSKVGVLTDKLEENDIKDIEKWERSNEVYSNYYCKKLTLRKNIIFT